MWLSPISITKKQSVIHEQQVRHPYCHYTPNCRIKILANEEISFCPMSSNKSCDMCVEVEFGIMLKKKSLKRSTMLVANGMVVNPYWFQKLKPTTIMYSFLFKLDHEMTYLFLVCTDWEDIKWLDEFHVPQKDGFQLTEFMLLWRLAAGMLSLAFSFSLLLTAPKRGQSKSCLCRAGYNDTWVNKSVTVH